MRRWILRIGVAFLLLLLLLVVALWLAMRASLPTLDGTAALPGLSAPVSIQRDALGVVTIDAVERNRRLRALATSTRRNGFSRWTSCGARPRVRTRGLVRRPGRGRWDNTLACTAFGAGAGAVRRHLGDRKAQVQAYTMA
jgi:penicillin amidase